MPLTTGTRAGRYEVVPALGFGGMGEAFRAGETKRDQTAAVRAPESVAIRASRQRQRTARGSNSRGRRWAHRVIDALRRSPASSK
jgi:hypothetical protein